MKERRKTASEKRRTAFRSHVGPNGVITLPKTVQEKYHLTEKKGILFVPVDDGILIKRRPTLRDKFRGKLDVKGG